MSVGKDALRGCAALVLGVATLGCSSGVARGPRAVETPKAQADAGQAPRLRPTAAMESNPPFRIAETPAPSTARPNEVLVAAVGALPPSATAPTVPQPDPPPAPPSASKLPAPAPSSGKGPALDDPPAEPLKDLRRLHKLAAAQYATMDSYIARLRRREQIGAKTPRDEILCLKFRKEPWSVSMKWIGTEGKGREVLYVKDKFDNKIHTVLAAGDMPYAPAGKKIALAVDSVLVKSASRHSITDAGIGALVEHFGNALEIAARGDPKRGSLTYLGEQTRPEFSSPREAAEQIIVAGADPSLPRGGRRLWYFDPESHLPVLVLTYDNAKREVEYYLYDKFQYPVKLDEDDFNPEKMGPKP
jgi:hypothetical protein